MRKTNPIRHEFYEVNYYPVYLQRIINNKRINAQKMESVTQKEPVKLKANWCELK